MKLMMISFAALLAIATRGYAAPSTNEYPLKTCIISGEELGEHGEPFVYMFKGREVRFCCKDCIGDFEKDPETYLKQIDEARKEKTPEASIELLNPQHEHHPASAAPASTGSHDPQ